LKAKRKAINRSDGQKPTINQATTPSREHINMANDSRADSQQEAIRVSATEHVPVASSERIGSIDVLRGFALLGILVLLALHVCLLRFEIHVDLFDALWSRNCADVGASQGGRAKVHWASLSPNALAAVDWIDARSFALAW
jgi:hypothetical protein